MNFGWYIENVLDNIGEEYRTTLDWNFRFETAVSHTIYSHLLLLLLLRVLFSHIPLSSANAFICLISMDLSMGRCFMFSIKLANVFMAQCCWTQP